MSQSRRLPFLSIVTVLMGNRDNPVPGLGAHLSQFPLRLVISIANDPLVGSNLTRFSQTILQNVGSNLSNL